MKVIAFLLPVIFISCTTTVQSMHRRARVTYYHKHEDRWGDRTASGVRAQEGVTVAGDQSVPLGSQIMIPELGGCIGERDTIMVVQDRGSAVERRLASHGCMPVLDVYCATRRKYDFCRKYMPEIMEVIYR